MTKAKVRDVDKGYKKLVKAVYGLQRPQVEIGILAADGAKPHPDGPTVLEVAIWQEFGTATIPERSFIRAWFDENAEKVVAATRAMLEAVIKGKYTKEQALELLCQRFVAEIQKRMADGIPPELKGSTLAKRKAKGFAGTTPLIQTGQLRSSISYSIDGKAGPKRGG